MLSPSRIFFFFNVYIQIAFRSQMKELIACCVAFRDPLYVCALLRYVCLTGEIRS